MSPRTVSFWFRMLVVLAIVLALPPSLWGVAKMRAARIENGGPLTWCYVASVLPCAVTMFLATKGWKRRHPRLLAGAVTSAPLIAACVALLISWATGTLVSLSCLNFPFMGMSLGWQLGGGWGLGERRSE